jgi:hypothetical protein
MIGLSPFVNGQLAVIEIGLSLSIDAYMWFQDIAEPSIGGSVSLRYATGVPNHPDTSDSSDEQSARYCLAGAQSW